MGKILIVDDDIVNSQLFVNKLTANGHTVTHAQDGQQAIDLLINKYDAILLDVMIPKVDGMTILKQAKTGINKSTPVLIYTNLMSQDTEKEALANGATKLLRKADLTPQQVIAEIEAFAPAQQQVINK